MDRNIWRQVSLGLGAVRVLTHQAKGLVGNPQEIQGEARLSMATALPLWGALSMVGWVVFGWALLGVTR